MCNGAWCLDYLLPRCKEKTQMIEECVLLSPEVGYEKACRVLNELFKCPTGAVGPLLGDWFEGIKTRQLHPDALSGFAAFLKSCKTASGLMKSNDNLYLLVTLRQIAKLLQYYLRKGGRRTQID